MLALVSRTSFRWCSRLCLLGFAFVATLSPAQTQPAVTSRIVSPVDETQLVTLKGDTLPVAIAKNDMGSVASNFAMTDLVLVLHRSPELQAAFDQFVVDQYDPTSADFHHWLLPDEVGTRFGPSLADISAITAWLGSYGLSVSDVSKDRMSIRFSGTAAQVQSAFHTEIHRLSVNGAAHIANTADPQVPAALAPVVSGVKALHDFLPHPLHRLGQQVSLNSATGSWQRVAPPTGPAAKSAPQNSAIADLAHPDLGGTIGSGTSTSFIEDVTPYDFATIYNVLPLWNANIDGTGQTIAIAGTSDINASDVATFRSSFGLPAGTAPTTIVANGIDPGMCTNTSPTAFCGIGDFIENTLDVEWSGAVAKGANIVLVVSGQSSPTTDTVYSSANYVIQNNTAKILNVSYGLCELFEGASGNAAYNNLWETAATEGIAVFVASGDSGSPACDQGLSQSAPYGAAYGLSVSGLASTPYNTAVGGTDFNWCKPTVTSTGGITGCSIAAPYWGSPNATNFSNAKGYVPEITWNDSCASNAGATYLESVASFLKISGVTDAETACNFVVNHYQSIYAQYGVDLSGFVYPIGAGGGASHCTTSDGLTAASCSGGYAKPGWQTGVAGIPSDGKRDIPDVSFFASNGFLNSAYVMCFTGQGYSCSYSNGGEPRGEEIGGTSVASPAMAGVMALINQKAGAAQGSPNAELYKLGARQTYNSCKAESVTTSTSCYFNDVDASTIAMPCQSGALNCTMSHAGDTWGLLSGYAAATGYDLASGLGSLNVANVVNSWTSTLGTAQATIAVAPSLTSVSINQSLTVQVTVTGSSGPPTGNVSLVGGGYTANAGALSSGSFTFTIPAYSLSAGSDTLTISYAGDTNYGESSATTTVNVTRLTPTVAAQPSPSSIGANTPVNVAVTVTGSGPAPTGTVQLSGGGYNSSSCILSASACTINIPSNTLTNGTDALTVTYSGDGVYTTATGTATETVNALTPKVTVTPSLTTLDTVTALPITVTVAGSGSTPSGTVLVNVTGPLGYYYGMGGTLVAGSFSFTMPPGRAPAGTTTLTANYPGDTTYLPANGTATIAVTKATPAISVATSAGSITSNLPLAVNVSITSPAESPTGTFTVSGGGYTGSSWYFGNASQLTIPPGSLAAGTDTLTVTYSGDAYFNSVSASTTVAVTQWTPAPSSLTVTSSASNIDSGQTLSVTGAVTGSYGTPTGFMTLTTDGYSGAQQVFNGNANFFFPPNMLSTGSHTLNIAYSGDATYLASSGTANVTVAQSVYSLSASPANPVAPGNTSFSTIAIASTTGYTGYITLGCSVTGLPSGARYEPTCAVTGAAYLDSSTTGASIVVDVFTTAPTAAALTPFTSHPFSTRLIAAPVLACLVLFGFSARRRNWRSFLGVLILFIAFGSLVSCGGGSSGGGGGSGTSGTTAGTYTVSVTSTGTPAVTPAPATTFTVIVN